MSIPFFKKRKKFKKKVFVAVKMTILVVLLACICVVISVFFDYPCPKYMLYKKNVYVLYKQFFVDTVKFKTFFFKFF